MPAVQSTVCESTCNCASVCAVSSQIHVPSVVVPSVVVPSVVEPLQVPPGKSASENQVSSFKSVTPRVGLYKRPGAQLSIGEAKLPRQNLEARRESHKGFPSDVHYRANLAYRKKYGKDRPNGRNTILLCDSTGIYLNNTNIVIFKQIFLFLMGVKQQKILLLMKPRTF